MARPFHWVPAGGRRHASTDARPGGGYPTGFVVLTLCGVTLRADNTEIGWLWGTCERCNANVQELLARPR